MRSVRAVMLLLTSAITLSLGCTPAHQEAFKAECVREAYKSEAGAFYVVSVIGFAAPVGNPLAVHALTTDLRFRSTMGHNSGMSGLAPSPFDAVDANRLVEIRRINETTTHYIIRDPDRPGEHSTITETRTTSP